MTLAIHLIPPKSKRHLVHSLAESGRLHGLLKEFLVSSRELRSLILTSKLSALLVYVSVLAPQLPITNYKG